MKCPTIVRQESNDCEALFSMSKYNATFKAQIVQEYLNGLGSYQQLAKKYGLNKSQVANWVDRFKRLGSEGLVRRSGRRNFSLDFKLSVINYYQTHEESLAEVAIKFDVLSSQVYLWKSAFERDGIEALKPRPKGRPSKMKKKVVKQFKQPAKKSELERLKEELAKKDKELYETRMERDILKKSLALFGPSKTAKKQ